MNEWKIARISAVMADRVDAKAMRTDLYDRAYYGQIRCLNSLNAYAFSYLDVTRKVVFKVVKIAENERYFSREPTSQSDGDIVLTLVPIAMVASENQREELIPGVIDIPMVGTDVFLFDAEELDSLLAVKNPSVPSLSLGHIPGFPSVRPEFSLDTLMSGHLAILGNTGSGKSTTARLLISRILELFSQESFKVKGGSKIVIFDVHGEYGSLADPELVKTFTVLRPTDFHLAAGDLDIEDWASILLPSEKVQKPLLERAVSYARLNDEGKNKLYALLAKDVLFSAASDSHGSRKIFLYKYLKKIENGLNNILSSREGTSSHQTIDNLLLGFKLNYGNIDDNVLRNLNDVLDQYLRTNSPLRKSDDVLQCPEYKLDSDQISLRSIRAALDFVFEEEEAKGNRQARAYSEGLVTQLDNLVNRYDDSLFSSSQGEKILDAIEGHNGVVVIDLSGIFDNDALRIVSRFVARRILQEQRKIPFCDRNPVYLWLDEAHRYVQSLKLDEGMVFEQIAREGRKFGCYLGVISQIPSELSKVILSQISTYIIHRVQNSIDLEFLVRNVPLVSQYQVSRFPMFSPGVSGLYSDRIAIPLEIVIDGDFSDATPPVSLLATDAEPYSSHSEE